MYRLQDKGFEILSAEVEICSSNDKQGQQKQLIALKRLQKLGLKAGKRTKLNELKNAIAAPILLIPSHINTNFHY